MFTPLVKLAGKLRRGALASAELQALAQAIDAVVSIDSRNRITFFNAAAEKLWGYRRDEVLGRNVSLLVPSDIRPVHDSLINRNRDTGVDRIVGTRREIRIERKDGSTFWGSMSLSKVRLGKKITYTAFIRDVSADVQLREERHLLSLVAHETDNAVIICDGNMQIQFVNRGFTTLFGYQLEEVRGKRPAHVLAGPETDRETLERVSQAALRPESIYEELLLYGKQGDATWVSTVVNPTIGKDGRLQHSISVLTNISETKQLQLLQDSILEAVACGLPVSEVAERICLQVERIAPDVIASVVRIDKEGCIRPLAAPSLPDSYIQLLDGLPIGPNVGSCGTAAFRGTPVIVSQIDTDPLWADYKHLALPLGLQACWSIPIKARDGRVVGTFALYYRKQARPSQFQHRIIDACVYLYALALEREEANARILTLALYDELTGLPNRWFLREKLDQAIARTRERGSQMAFLFLDLDRFKHINDSLGHPIGDRLLQVVAQRLKQHAQQDWILGRFGGDEFVLVLPDCGAEWAGSEVERLLACMVEPVRIDDHAITTSVSIGISLFPHDGDDIDTLFKHADMAMYQAKSAGRGTFRFFSHDLNRRAQDRLTLETALRVAISTRQLTLHYQPQVRLGDGSLYGVEALARWQHPAHGTISPAQFVPLAEECGLGDALGEWALDEACSQLSHWRRLRLPVPSVSVNLSPRHFRSIKLVELVSDTLRRHGLSACDLRLELTEGAMLDTRSETRATLAAIRALGIQLAMDDFGTGYSSLSQLGQLAIDELKIDRGFIHQLEESARARTLASGVIRIGTGLNLTLVAEGVETEYQRRFLEEHGCQIVQGYLLARPLPPEQLEAWISEREALTAARQPSAA